MSSAELYMSISRTSIYINEFYSGKVVLMSYILGLCVLNLKLLHLVGMLSIQILLNKPVRLLLF